MYLHEHNKVMSTTSLAKMISIMMYGKRFFPYYTSTIIAGLDPEGKGCVYSYDPIGHTERASFRAGGSSGALLQALLDNQVSTHMILWDTDIKFCRHFETLNI